MDVVTVSVFSAIQQAEGINDAAIYLMDAAAATKKMFELLQR